MAKKLKITEDQLKRLISNQKTISEQPGTGGSVNFADEDTFTSKNMNEHEGEEKHYMFFNSLEEIKRKAELLLNKIDHEMMDKLLDEHDWAAAHITTAENDLSQVFDFFMNKAKGDHVEDEEENPHDKGMDNEEHHEEDEEDEDDEMMNKNIKDEDKDEDDEDKEEMNESIKKIKANFQRFL
jgi:hypothetical protein